MTPLLSQPLDEVLTRQWVRLDPALKRSFLAVLCVSVLAFGFEMTNLSMLHDDFTYIFVQSPILGTYMGRFGFGWLHYYTQGAFLMPFFQMAQGIVLMALYGLAVAHFWGARKALDLTLIAAATCIFPYMAQLYQFNVSMAPFPAAHLLAAAAAILATRARLRHAVAAVVLYAAAFSIYQSVLANASVILLGWAVLRVLSRATDEPAGRAALLRRLAWALACMILGGLVYVLAVHLLGLPIHDPKQAADQAFQLGGLQRLSDGMAQVVTGTRAFFLWPESYFPHWLKRVHLFLVLAAAVACVLLPRTWFARALALGFFVLMLLAPRALQLLHSEGHFPNRALTGYALIAPACLLVIHQTGRTVLRNLSSVAVMVLLWGYALQCNWITTVNYLNTTAHLSTFVQVLSALKATAHGDWDGREVVVVGRLDMPADYPFRQSDGVASEFFEGPYLDRMSRLLRTGVRFEADDGKDPRVREFAGNQRPWPHPGSVRVIGGKGVVVLSNDNRAAGGEASGRQSD